MLWSSNFNRTAVITVIYSYSQNYLSVAHTLLSYILMMISFLTQDFEQNVDTYRTYHFKNIILTKCEHNLYKALNEGAFAIDVKEHKGKAVEIT